MHHSFLVLKPPACLAWSPPPLLGSPLPSQRVLPCPPGPGVATLGSTRAASPYRERTSPFPTPLHSVTWVQLTVQKAIGSREPWRMKDKVRDTSTRKPKAPLPSSPRHLAEGGPQGRPRLPDHRCRRCCCNPNLQESGGRGAGWGGAGAAGGRWGGRQGELLTERQGGANRQTDSEAI